MLKHWIIAVVIILLSVGSTLAVKYWPRTVPEGECSELFRRYSDDSHVQVSFVKGFRVNDTLRLDVTVIEALDSLGWARLKEDFGYPYVPPEIEKMIAEHNTIGVSKIKKGCYSEGMDTVDISNNDYLVIKHSTRSLFIFQSTPELQDRQIIDRFFNEIKTQTT